MMTATVISIMMMMMMLLMMMMVVVVVVMVVVVIVNVSVITRRWCVLYSDPVCRLVRMVPRSEGSFCRPDATDARRFDV